ncbi:hypothetical protein [Streptomyces sp. SID4982]|uniref:hypothetical protein n=1 Tax=Streptomyces sp. SID4982 TaxID=2690291 RepID=UPI00136EF117|nr:hypothetical protein [Streptomyces sp. SID4982]MYS15066.1 hypothetical protein [Streptomyces sp. SID4982]
MSRRLIRSLTCDKPLCTAEFIASDKEPVTEGELRHNARETGWKRTPGNRDYCPSHNPWPGLAAWALAPEGGAA